MKETILGRILQLQEQIHLQQILEEIYHETGEFERISGKKEIISILHEECQFLKTLINLL